MTHTDSSPPVGVAQADPPPAVAWGHAASLDPRSAPPAAPARSLPLRPEKIFWQALGIVALLLLNLGRDAGAAVFFLILIGMTLRGPAGAYKALAICYMGLMINQAFVPKSLVWTPGRLILPPLAAIVFVTSVGNARARLFATPTYLTLMLYVATMAVCSILSGWYTHIALLKLFNFWICVTAVFAGVSVIRARKIDLTEWIVALIVAAIGFGLASILLGQGRNFIAMGGVDLVNRTQLFNGAFLHPNCHSLYASMFVLFMAIIYILGQYRSRWLAFPVIAVWLCFMVMSKSRTSMVATIIPTLVLIAYAGSWRTRLGERLKSNVSRSTIIAVAVASIVLLLVADIGTGGQIGKAVVKFVNKSHAEDTAETLDKKQILSSRQALIDHSWNNFEQSPVYGIGFQVAKTAQFVKMATLFSAPAEKGFLPTALLEEGGILGATTFVLFLLALVGEWIRTRNAAALVLFTGFMVSNFGEVSIFSPGGSGGFGWIMVGAAAILGDHCWKKTTIANPRRHPTPRGPLVPIDLRTRHASLRGG